MNAALVERVKSDNISLVSMIRLGAMYSKAEPKDFVKLIKEMEDGD